MKKVLFLSVLLSSSFANAGLNLNYRAYNTPVNYNFAEIKASQHSYKFDNNTDLKTTLTSIGSEFMLDEDMIVSYSFSGEKMNDSASLAGFKLGLLHRTALAEKTDLVFGGELELAWLALEANNETDYTEETGLGANIGVRHGFTDKFEGGIQFNVSHFSDTTATEATAKLSYYVTKKFGLGVFYTAGFSDDANDSKIGGHVRFRF